jgi:hypothetical protein
MVKLLRFGPMYPRVVDLLELGLVHQDEPAPEALLPRRADHQRGGL